jgi:hypothetical protein
VSHAWRRTQPGSFDRLRADLLDQLGGLRLGAAAAPLDAP